MLPKNNEKEDSSNLIDEESKQLQGETCGDSLKKSLTIIGIILPIFFIVSHNNSHDSFFQQKTPLQGRSYSLGH